jgi:hypothetical protein
MENPFTESSIFGTQYNGFGPGIPGRNKEKPPPNAKAQP